MDTQKKPKLLMVKYMCLSLSKKKKNTCVFISLIEKNELVTKLKTENIKFITNFSI